MLHLLADAALKRLASLLASYGLGLPELSPQQLSSLSTLLQLLQSSGEQGAGTGSSGCQHALFQGRGCFLLGQVLQELLSLSIPGVAGPEVPTMKRVGLQQGGAGGGAVPQVGCWGRGRQSPRTLLKGPSSSLPLSAGDGGGYAARREASAPFLHSATPQNPSQQLPRGWAEGQGSVLTRPPSGGTERTQWGCAQPWEANCGAEEELHGCKGWWGAAWHTATRRVWLHHHRPEVRTGDRMGGDVEGLCLSFTSCHGSICSGEPV